MYELVKEVQRPSFVEKGNIIEAIALIKRLPIEELLKDVFLEVLIRISRIIYLRSCLLLKIKQEEEEVTTEIVRPIEQDGLGVYHKGLLGREELYKERFFCRIEEEPLEEVYPENGVELIVRGILWVLDRMKGEVELKERLPEVSIEEYMSEVRSYLRDKGGFKFLEFLRSKKLLDLAKVVYYFLAILFLSYARECYLVQNSEDEDIGVYAGSL